MHVINKSLILSILHGEFNEISREALYKIFEENLNWTIYVNSKCNIIWCNCHEPANVF